MILKAFKTALFIMCIYIGIFSYQKYQSSHKTIHPDSLRYNKQILTLSNLWTDDQFQNANNNYKPLQFQYNQQQQAISVKVNSQKQSIIKIGELGLQSEDAEHIESVKLIDEVKGIILIQSQFFKFIIALPNGKICYNHVGRARSNENFYVDGSGRLWIFSYPHNNILLLRVFDCENNELLYTWKDATLERVQLLSSIVNINGKVTVKLLTFGRNYLIYTFDQANFVIHQQSLQRVYSFEYFVKQISQFEVKLSQKIKSKEFKASFQQFIHKLSFGFLGSVANQTIKLQQQLDFQFQAFDLNKSIMVYSNKYVNYSQIISFDQVLVPLRTPIFVSKEGKERLLPFDEILNKSRTDQNIPAVDFKMYTIKHRNIEVIKGKTGLYRLLPDSKVHFMTFDNKFLTFYPQENLSQDQYYLVRIAQGGIVMKGREIKGIFEEAPVPNPYSDSLKFGYSEDEIYHEHTTNGNEIGSGIYEAHAAHKGFFVQAKKNRIQLITSLSGQSVLTHYLSTKSNYEYSISFIENNEFWVFEHKINAQPLITKYELFVNSSAPKNLLSIKRNYDLGIKGRITRVQKCIDYFYYFTYITDDNKFGVARIHHALMSNRQSRDDENYSGAFERAMIIPNIQRNTKFVISDSEEQLIKLELPIDQKVLKGWKQLEFKHQYKILPIRMFSYKNQYHVFNLRKLMQNAYDMQIESTRKNVFLYIFMVAVGLSGIIGLLIGVSLFKRKKEPQIKAPIKEETKAEPKVQKKLSNKSKKSKNKTE